MNRLVESIAIICHQAFLSALKKVLLPFSLNPSVNFKHFLWRVSHVNFILLFPKMNLFSHHFLLQSGDIIIDVSDLDVHCPGPCVCTWGSKTIHSSDNECIWIMHL